MKIISLANFARVWAFAMIVELLLVCTLSAQVDNSVPPIHNNNLPRLSVHETISLCYIFQPRQFSVYYRANPAARESLLKLINHISESKDKYFGLSFKLLGLIGEDSDADYLDKLARKMLRSAPEDFKMQSYAYDCIDALGNLAYRGSPAAKRILEKYATWDDLEQLPFIAKMRKERFVQYANLVDRHILMAMMYESVDKHEMRLQSFEKTLDAAELEMWKSGFPDVRKRHHESISVFEKSMRDVLSEPLTAETEFDISTCLVNIPEDVIEFLQIPENELETARKKDAAHTKSLLMRENAVKEKR